MSDSKKEKNKEQDKEQLHDVDYILQEIVGGGSWWQLFLSLLITPLMYTGGFPLFLPMFAAYAPRHRCYVDQCDNKMSSVNESWVDFAIPKEHTSKELFTEDDPFDPCHVYESVDQGSCSADSFSSNKSLGCSEYVFDRTYFEETLVTETGLVCDEEYKRRLLSTIMMVGLMIGSLIGGWMSDRYGRKVAILLSLVLNIPSVLISGLVPNYHLYAALRLVTCTALAIMWMAMYTYSLEIFSPRYRRIIITLRDIPIHGFIFILLIYLSSHWTYMHITFALIMLLSAPTWYFMPESPRWLASNNRSEEAEQLLHNIAKTNRRELTEEQTKKIKKILMKVDSECEEKLSPLDLFKREKLSKFFILLLCWNTTVVGYYALTLNSTKLHGDPVLNYVYATLFDTPVFILIYFILDGWGRRWTLFGSLSCLGISTVFLAFVPKSWTTTIFIAYMIGKTGGGIAFTCVYLVTAELYPTNLRSSAIGMCSMLSRIGGMGANFVPMLAVYWAPLPMLVLGVPALLSAVLSLLLRETSGKELPQSIKASEQLEMEAHPHAHSSGGEAQPQSNI